MKNLFFLSMLFTLLISCGENDNELVGTWTLDFFTTGCPDNETSIIVAELIQADENSCYDTPSPDGIIQSNCLSLTLENDGSVMVVSEGSVTNISEQTWVLEEDGRTLTLCINGDTCNEYTFDGNSISSTVDVVSIDAIGNCEVTVHYSKK